MHRRSTRYAAACTNLIAFALAAGCTAYQPQPLAEKDFARRAESQERDGVRVSVSVLARDEAQSVFGVDLYDSQIQPVWIHIENDTEQPAWFMLHGLDPNYFSAREAAYKSHSRFRPGNNRKIDEHFERLGINPIVPPMGATVGFAFGHVKLGTKEVRIRLFKPGRFVDFHFYLQVPGFLADSHGLTWEEFIASTEFVDLETEEQLYGVLQTLPCCTTRKIGSGKGDPLNLIVVAPERGLYPFFAAGWDETELLTLSSGWKTFTAFFGGRYRYSPMSALYYDGRPQSLGLQKARDTIHERNHLRLWTTPWRYKSDYVFVGTITRDIGVYFTSRAWNLTTHAIDPNVDEARSYLVEDLVTTELVKTYGLVDGIGSASKDEPHRNLMNAPWWTDGRRAVIHFADRNERVPVEDLKFFGFFEYGDRMKELRGKTLGAHNLVEPLVE